MDSVNRPVTAHRVDVAPSSANDLAPEHPGIGTSRRGVLAGIGTVALASVAGCLGRGDVASLPTPIAGDPDGEVVLRVFSDFSCSHCRRYHLVEFPTLEAGLLADGGVRYEHYDFPIPVSQEWSWTAPQAARAVQALGGDAAFWAYSTKLYEYQGRLTFDRLEQFASAVGVDGGTVRAAAGDGRYRDVVVADREYGDELGVPGTPGILLGTTFLSPSAVAIEQAVEAVRSA